MTPAYKSALISFKDVIAGSTVVSPTGRSQQIPEPEIAPARLSDNEVGNQEVYQKISGEALVSTAVSPETPRTLPTIIKEYVAELQDEKPRHAGVLLSMECTVTGNVLRVVLQSSTQATIFSEMKKEFEERVRAGLCLPLLESNVVVSEIIDKPAKPYSPQDKYNFLKSKNEHLEKLKEKFNLNLKQ